MKLAIDIGNTLTKVALFQDNDLVKLRSFKEFTIEELTLFIGESETKNNKIISSVISSVKEYDHKIDSFLNEKYFFVKLSSKTPLPVIIRYNTPETLGKDRVAAVCGASSIFPEENILVIDAGTCITYDFIDKEKNYLGGGISPGIDIRFKALNTFTGNLPLVNRDDEFDLIGKSTEGSIKSGVLNGVLAEIEGIIKRYEDRFGRLKIIFTGGDTIFFDKRLKNDIFAIPNLVLNGLNEILEYSINKSMTIH